MGEAAFLGLQELKYYKEAGCRFGVYYEDEDAYQIEYYFHHTNTIINEKTVKLQDVKLFSKVSIDSRKIILINNSHSDYALEISPDLINTPVKSMIFIPLYYDDKFICLFSYSRSG
jgi:hypothetical protein